MLIVLGGQQVLAQDTSLYKTLPPVTISPTNTKVPEKVWKSFEKYFATAENPKWYEANKTYLVKFMTEDNTNKALMTKNGHLIYHISYGYEKNLPEDIRKQVKGSYYDYEITRAIKVTGSGRTIWVVNLEDSKEFILVMLEEGDMEEVQKITKS